jgi:hypothetical protein
MTPAERILERLDGVRPNGKARWIAQCPAHQDKTSSLSIREVEDGRVLLHCFGGCTTDAVLAAAGLELKDLFTPRESNSRPVESERDQQLRDFKRKHPNAHESFFEPWLELRGTGWVEIGSPVGRAAMEFAATAPTLPDFPGELIAHHRLGQPVPVEGQPFGDGNLKALAAWIAESLRTAFNQPFNQAKTPRQKTPSSTQVRFNHQTVTLGVGQMVKPFDPLAKFHQKLERMTRGAR